MTIHPGVHLITIILSKGYQKLSPSGQRLTEHENGYSPLLPRLKMLPPCPLYTIIVWCFDIGIVYIYFLQ